MFREGLRPPDPFRRGPPLEEARTQDGMSLKAVSEMGPALVVCLPELGTRTCRRLLRRVAAERAAIEGEGVRLVLVHPSPDPEAVAAFAPYGLEYVMRISDADRALYDHFELRRARSGILRREEQLAGAFLLRDFEVKRAGRSKRPGDLPELRW